MPTALDLTPEERQRYIEALKKRPSAPGLSREDKRHRAALIARVRQAASALKSRFGVRRVVLFGSLAHASWFMPDSDVDLAVDGLRSEDYWEAWRLVEELIGDRQVDFIEIERAEQSLKSSIERHGVEL
ncbi:MAG: nucleotidyltransferase domain-containing protein [Desulfobacteraceae bacterium]|nr:nucleotidyltransferase domain-containing protein [Desulfobacteraceae bacterium]